MKKILAFIMVFIFISMGNAGDLFNQAASKYEGFSFVHYTFQFTFADSSSAYHSKPLYIGDCNDVDGYVDAVQSATGDANVIYHFSKDRSTWTTSTPAGFDATSSTAKFDTIGVEAGANVIAFHNSKWLVVEVVGGGTNNHDGNVFTMNLMFTKDAKLSNNGQYIEMGGIANGSTTNP